MDSFVLADRNPGSTARGGGRGGGDLGREFLHLLDQGGDLLVGGCFRLMDEGRRRLSDVGQRILLIGWHTDLGILLGSLPLKDRSPHFILGVGQLGQRLELLFVATVALVTDKREAELGGGIADIMVAVTVDTQRVADVELLSVIPSVRSGGEIFVLVFVTGLAFLKMGTHFGTDEAGLGRVGFGVIDGVAAVTIVAGDTGGKIMNGMGEGVDCFGQLAAGGQVALDAIGLFLGDRPIGGGGSFLFFLSRHRLPWAKDD